MPTGARGKKNLIDLLAARAFEPAEREEESLWPHSAPRYRVKTPESQSGHADM